MRIITGVVLVLLVSTALANFLFAEPKLDRALRQAISKENAKAFPVLVHFQPLDTDNYLAVADVEERANFLVNDLQVHAALTQGSIIEKLKKEKVAHKTIWISNSISIKACSVELIEYLAVHPLVKVVVLDEDMTFDFEKPTFVAPKADEVEWNVEWIQGKKVWDELKHQGEGITVGIIDTGAAYQHEAIADNYRGKSASGLDHNYNWFQAIGGSSPTPIDDHGHGTHCAGTVLGATSSHAYGVAPKAKFISCKAFTGGGSGSKQSILDCLQFMLAPHDLDGQNPDPSKRPEVISNSYVCPSCGLKSVIDTLITAGIQVVAAAGNYGPGCSSVSAEPGIFDNVLSIGALEIKKDNVTSFSSRGPVRVDGSNRIKPDVTAPGRDILSAMPPNSYGKMSGTSMACPHVAGAVALAWSAVPELKRNPKKTKELIEKHARNVDVSGTYCGSSGIPNNMYGHGTTQIFDAIKGAKKMF